MKTLILSAIALITTSAFVFGQEKEINKEVKVVKEIVKTDSEGNSSKKEVKIITKKINDDGTDNVVIITKTKDGKTTEKQIKYTDDETVEINSLIDSILKGTIDNIDIDFSGSSKIKVFTYPSGEESGNWFNNEGGNWIDIEDIKEIEEIHLMDSKRPFLGVILDDEMELDQGIRVINVIENSAAEKAGIQKDDIILGINDNKINSLKDLVTELSDKEIGNDISLQLKRSEDFKNVTATLQSKAESKYNLSNSFQFKTPDCCAKSEGKCCKHHSRTYKAFMHQSKPKLGIHVENLDTEMIKDLRIKEEAGVLITKVLEESTAKKMGLKLNDVVTRINNVEIKDVTSLNEYLAEQKLGNEIEVTYYRYGKVKKVKGVLFEFNYSNENFEWMKKE